MSKKLECQWRETIVNVNSIQDKSVKMISALSGIVFDAICAILFFCSARIMLSDIYYWGEFEDGELFKLIISAFVISAIMELNFIRGKKVGGLIKSGVLFVGLLCIGAKFLGEDGEDIIAGFIKIIAYYIEDWNEYYNSMWYIEGGRTSYVMDAMELLTSLLLLVLLWWAKVSKENLVMIVAPILVFILELMVGYSPEYPGIVILFVAVMMSNAVSWKRNDFKKSIINNRRNIGVLGEISWCRVAIISLIFSGIVYVIGSDSAWMAVRNGDELKDYCNEIIAEFEDSELWAFFEGNDSTRKEKITNDEPKYRYIPVIKVESTYKPGGDIYLKGFYGGTYSSGAWKKDVAAFENACEREGFESKYVSESLAELAAKNIRRYIILDALKYSQYSRRTEITYYDTTSEKIYVPYFSEVEETLLTEGDCQYVKPEDFEGIMTVYSWRNDWQYEEYLQKFKNSGKDAWEIWYEKYVRKTYTIVPENMNNVKSVANEIRQWPVFDDAAFRYNESELRVLKAKCVAKWMEENTTYTLKPSELPFGKDPVEYFLGESKEGYCMHYASASALILRELGVPARYASGYIAASENFRYGSQLYQYEILDSDAHAWVEIYLEGMGWIPVEVTKGFNDDLDEWNPQEETTEERETTRPQQSTKPQETTTKPKPGESETTKPQETTTKKKDGGNVSGDGDSEKTNGISAKNILIFMAIAVFVGIVVCLVYKFKIEYKKKLAVMINRGKTLMAIRLINRRIYQKAKLTGKILKLSPRDDEFEQSLVKHYPQVSKENWGRYMDIVKAAAFSKRRFSVEEMEFCYEIYKTINGRNKK